MKFNYTGAMSEGDFKKPQYFNNSNFIKIADRFISDMHIQGFRPFHLEYGNEDIYRPRTYLNMSEVGTKIHYCNIIIIY